MTSPFLGEFMGTLVLCLMGCSNVANVVLKKSKGEGGGWIVVATGWGLAVAAGVFTAIATGSPDAHINPAVTLGFAVRSGDFTKVGTYFTAQTLGALIGAILAWLAYLPHWKETDDAGLKLAVFTTAPAIRHPFSNVITEVIGTFLLVLVVASIFSRGVSPAGPAGALGPFLVGSTVWGIGLCLGGPTGFSLNPARDLGPRIAHAILPIPGKGGSDWSYAFLPVAGALVGGVLAGAFIAGVDF
jgi:glycerol uptake facilitator protein